MAAPKLTDHSIPWTSTIPANKNKPATLFVRERDGTKPNHPREPVLMLHGRSVPALAGFDLQHPKYGWADDLAQAGYDVFIMDLQGSGRSTRPEMSDPRNVNPVQKPLLSTHPGGASGPVQYQAQLDNSQSNWDEVHKVVTYIKTLTSASKVDLIGWSAAAQQLGPYAIQHKDNVRSLLLLAPVFPPNGRQSKPGTRWEAPVDLPVKTPEAVFGFPMTLSTKAGVQATWDRDLKCRRQREEGMVDVVWKAIMENDSIGATWGPEAEGAPGVPGGVMRVKNPYWWGWNSTTVGLDGILGADVPVLIIYGDLDSIVNTASNLGLLYFSVPALYDLIPGSHKLTFRIACAGHQIPWEIRAKTVQRMSRHWLKDHTVEGLAKGSYFLDEDDVLTPMD
ncbi:alpha/beta hydrolase [Streptomyces cinnabarinus]|uniref:Alpha/beta hydrolase n=1 Tax=Streptomyces cinnabarinus TaxID=67287 RepID=A0ABY7K6X0_9ACTN|nr:alpha/beta fold hydrolase [Streptomyces cinnabarinus]WAZ19278.1 alpha/beta hydrolase [Streptomyces cinnabarinus]